ncbi:ferredoxin [Desulfoscipio gibsoniae]|uniref:Ferredoxin n=1 Tax=Desulfoscipio gibsoniae DSM 7213 TaxID=767817 RepID=R4KPJ0_9FIRM|nr:ferredoxin [Desulfoscipio gibsoniae]AGL01556.1 ferredoxin [Desulfoscipio gibsoniae DSM 7213]
MHAEVDQDLCISCGACIDTCPDVFEWNDEEKAHSTVDEIPNELEDQASEAAEGCPTDAITVN